jgi:hypothetical protein
MGYVVMGVDVCVLCCVLCFVVGWKEGAEKGGLLGERLRAVVRKMYVKF